jgi:TonB family protein
MRRAIAGVLGALLLLATPALVHGQADPERPTFTPYTVAPSLLNAEEVQAALIAAYPPELREQGTGGRVMVLFYIDTAGLVQNTILNESSGNEALDEAALSVARVFRFSPALNRDERVAVWVSIPVAFQPPTPRMAEGRHGDATTPGLWTIDDERAALVRGSTFRAPATLAATGWSSHARS